MLRHQNFLRSTGVGTVVKLSALELMKVSRNWWSDKLVQTAQPAFLQCAFYGTALFRDR